VDFAKISKMYFQADPMKLFFGGNPIATNGFLL